MAQHAPDSANGDPPRPWMVALWLLPLATLAVQLITFRGYGFFRDELYYLASAEHLGFGYVEHPPMIGLLAWLVRSTLGDSLFAARLLPAVAHAVIVGLAAAIAREMGGGRYAQFTAGLATAVAPAYVGICAILSMNAFDILCWAALWLILARILRTGHDRLWLLFGLVAGIGLQNKISILFLGSGAVVGLLMTRRWEPFRSWRFWAGGVLAAAIFLPHIVWQWYHGWPTLEFIANAAREKNVALAPASFMAEQVLQMSVLAAPLWVAGLAALLVSRALRPFRTIGWAYLVVLSVMLVTNAKPYYLAAAYTALFAAGAVAVEWLRPRHWSAVVRPVVVALVIVSGVVSFPLAKPVLPTETFLDYAAALGMGARSEERHEMGRLPQQYADMHGWQELAENLARVYHALPDADRVRACIYVQNYGEAGAVDILGAPLGLPRAISGHNSYFLWGPRGCTGDVLIALGGDREDYEAVFERVDRAGTHTCTDCMPYENDRPIWIARGARVPMSEIWPRTKRFI